MKADGKLIFVGSRPGRQGSYVHETGSVGQHRDHQLQLYHRLQTIDTAGVPQGLPWHRELWSGDVREVVVRGGVVAPPDDHRDDVHPRLPGADSPHARVRRAWHRDMARRVHGKNSQSYVGAEKRVQQVRFEHEQLREARARLGNGDSLAPVDASHTSSAPTASSPDSRSAAWSVRSSNTRG
jgi:hypothetical protein